jgi:hypothetical protein
MTDQIGLTVTINQTTNTVEVSAPGPQGPSGSAGGSIGQLSDVTLSLPVTAKDILIYNGTVWRNTILAVADIPSLPASQTTSGEFDTARIPDLSATYATTSHGHTLSDISDAGTAAASDTGDFAAASHSHALGDLTDVDTAGATTGQVLAYDGADWVVTTPTSGTSDHGLLTGLGDDDHTQYALADGSRGTFEVSGAVSTHAAITSGVHGISTFGASLVDDADSAAARTTLGLGTAATSASTDFLAASAVSVFGLTLIDDADAATARTTLGLAINTDVQAYDAELAAIAGLTSASGKAIEFTGSGTAATFDITTAGKALLDDADAAAQRTTLGLGTLATQSTIQDSYLMLIESPTVGKTYTLDGRVAAARTVTNYYAKTLSGTCTAVLKNLTDATTIGSITVTSTGASAGSLSNTAVDENDRLGLEISIGSTPADLEIVVEYTQ